MEDTHRPNRENLSLGIEDFHWGKTEGPVEIGLWVAKAAVEPGKKVELRAAARNVSSHRIGLGPDIGLVVKHDEEVDEYFGGPRSSEPIFLEPGEFKELLGWSLGEDSGLKAGINECWVIYRTAGEELKSAVVEIDVLPSAE